MKKIKLLAVLATMILFKAYACDGIDDQCSASSAQPSMRAVAESQDAQRHLETGHVVACTRAVSTKESMLAALLNIPVDDCARMNLVPLQCQASSDQGSHSHTSTVYADSREEPVDTHPASPDEKPPAVSQKMMNDLAQAMDYLHMHSSAPRIERTEADRLCEDLKKQIMERCATRAESREVYFYLGRAVRRLKACRIYTKEPFSSTDQEQADFLKSLEALENMIHPDDRNLPCPECANPLCDEDHLPLYVFCSRWRPM
ncbi:MAG: hypothetical protein LCH26_02085 [Proteobacteria bacterium]|nr:hypothetical protein [Pseudomonadota bacterium]